MKTVRNVRLSSSSRRTSKCLRQGVTNGNQPTVPCLHASTLRDDTTDPVGEQSLLGEGEPAPRYMLLRQPYFRYSLSPEPTLFQATARPSSSSLARHKAG